MSELERAKLIPVEGENDQPRTDESIDVQFNPVDLKVALSNTLRANEREGNSRAAQYVDKSSSTLTVDLQFDSTHDGSDVRKMTSEIALKFLKPEGEDDEMRAPRKCLFQWGAFEFVGLLQTFNETLDFFSPEGRPLRAKVALKLAEDRFQFRIRDEGLREAQRNTPTLTPVGSGAASGGSSDTPVSEASRQAGRKPEDWRDTARYNGIENPRVPAMAQIAVPGKRNSQVPMTARQLGEHLLKGAPREAIPFNYTRSRKP